MSTAMRAKFDSFFGPKQDLPRINQAMECAAASSLLPARIAPADLRSNDVNRAGQAVTPEGRQRILSGIFVAVVKRDEDGPLGYLLLPAADLEPGRSCDRTVAVLSQPSHLQVEAMRADGQIGIGAGAGRTDMMI